MRLLFRVCAFCVIAGALSTTALAQNGSWNVGAGNTNFADYTNWTFDGGPYNLSGQPRLFINVTGVDAPVYDTNVQVFPGSAIWDFDIGDSADAGWWATPPANIGDPGTFTQQNGSLNVNYAINIGNGVTTGANLSSYFMNDGTLTKLNGAGAFAVGTNGGGGQFVMTGTSVYNQTAGGWLFVGSGGASQGLFSMSGTSTANLNVDMRVGDGEDLAGTGCSGTLSMSGNSTINRSGGGYNMFGQGAGNTGTFTMTGNAEFLNATHTVITGIGWDSGVGTMTMGPNNVYESGEMIVGTYSGTGHVTTTGGTVTLNTSPDWSWYGYEGTLDIGRFSGTGTVSFTDTVVNVSGRTNIGNTSSAGAAIANGSLVLAGDTVMTTHPGTMRNWGYLWTDGGDVYVGCNEWEYGAVTYASQGGTPTGIGGNGSLTVQDTATLTTSGQIIIGNNGGTGSFTQTGGTVNSGGAVRVGCGNGGIGTLSISGGQFNAPAGWEAIGIGEGSWDAWSGGGHVASHGTVTVSGTGVLYGPQTMVLMSRWGGESVWNQSGGTSTISYVTMGEQYSNTVINLTGGVFATSAINGSYYGGGGPFPDSSILNLNGGTLRATGDNDNFINPNSSTTFHAYVGSGNAIIDSNGFAVGVQGALEAGTPSGGLIKQGVGTVTLYGVSSYTGPTTIQAGTLAFASDQFTSVVPAGGPIDVKAGATLGSAVGGSLTVNADVVFQGSSHLLVGFDGSILSRLSVNDVSAGTDTATFGKPVLVGVMATSVQAPASWLTGASKKVLSYASESVAPTFLPEVASWGQCDLTVFDNGVDSVYLNVSPTQSGQRGLQTNSGAWSTSTWYEAGYAAGYYAGHPVNDPIGKAWFDEDLLPGGGTVALDVDVTLASILFNGGTTSTPSNWTISGTTNTITLSPWVQGVQVAGSAQIQVLSGNHVIQPNIVMYAGDPIISVASGASLTLSGDLSEVDGDASVTVLGGGLVTMSSPTSSYTGTLTVAGGSSLVTAYVPPASTGGVIVLNSGNLTYTGAANVTRTVGSDYFASGSSQFTLNSAATWTFQTNQGTAALAHDMNILGGGTVNLSCSVPTYFYVNDRLGPIDTAADTNGTLSLSPNATFDCNAIRLAGNGASNTNFTIQGGRVIDNVWFYLGGHDGVGGTGTVTLRDTNFSTGNELSIGRDSGQGFLHVYNSTVTIGDWVNIGCWDGGSGNGATGTMTVENHSTVTVAGEYDMACYDGANHSAELSISNSSMVVSGHFYSGVWTGGASHGAITLTDGTLTVGTGTTQVWNGSAWVSNREWLQLGDGSPGSSFTLTMTGHSVFNSQENGAGLLNAGTATLSDYAQFNAPAGDTRIGISAGTASMSLYNFAQLNVANLLVGMYDSNGTLTVNDSATVTATGQISAGVNWAWPPASLLYGVGNIVVNGGTVTAGRIVVGADGGIGYWTQAGGSSTSSNTVYVGEYDIEDLGGSQLPGAGTLTLTGGVFAAPGLSTHNEASSPASSGVINFDGGTLTATGSNGDFIKSDASRATMTLNVLANGAKINSNGYYVQINQPLVDGGGGGGLTKLGSGYNDLLCLNATNTYTGPTKALGGILYADDGIGLPSSNLTLDNGAQWMTISQGTITRSLGTGANQIQFGLGGGGFAADPSGDPLTVNLGNGATLDWSDTPTGHTLCGTLKLNSNWYTALNGGYGVVTVENNINLNGNRTIWEDSWPGYGGSVMTGVIANGTVTGSTLTKDGPGPLTLTGANTYTGLTTVAGGTLTLAHVGGLAIPGDVLLKPNTWLIFGQPNQVGGSVTWNCYAEMALQGNSQTVTGISNTSDDQAVIENTHQSLLNPGASSTLTVNVATGNDCTFNGTIRDDSDGASGTTLALTKEGPGTLTLGAGHWAVGNTYTGGTNVNAGTLACAADGVLGSGPVAVNGGTLALGATSHSIASVTLTSGAITGTGTLTSSTGFEVQSGSVSAVLAGPGGLLKSTTGLVTMTGSTTFGGTTVLNGGRLELNAASSAAVLANGIDIQSGRLVINYAPGSDPVVDITNALAASYDGGAWDSGTIRSSTAAGLGLTLGWFDDTVNDQITIARTVLGDFNLDGSVDGQDLAIWLANSGASGQIFPGDANFDSSVDGQDLAVWLANSGASVVVDDYVPGAPVLGVAAGAPVPEPGTLALLLPFVALFGYVVARRRSK